MLPKYKILLHNLSQVDKNEFLVLKLCHNNFKIGNSIRLFKLIYPFSFTNLVLSNLSLLSNNFLSFYHVLYPNMCLS